MNRRGMTKQEAADYCGCESMAAFDSWRSKGIIPGPIPGTSRWDRKALNVVMRRPLDPDLFGDSGAAGMFGQIYFVTDGRDTKIGYTRRWTHRLSNLRTASPRLLWPLILFCAGPAQEHQMHHYFREIRVRGEWFAHGPMIMKMVKTIQSLGLDCLERT
jgi:hypothetical protein